jgi:hypothetical protein
MFIRVLMLAFAFVMVPALLAAAEDEKPNIHEGKVKEVKAAEAKLIMTDKDGKNEHSHFVAKDVKITVNGKPGKLEDLKPGQVIRVTTRKKEDKVLVVEIEAKKAD